MERQPLLAAYGSMHALLTAELFARARKLCMLAVPSQHETGACCVAVGGHSHDPLVCGAAADSACLLPCCLSGCVTSGGHQGAGAGAAAVDTPL